MADEKKSSAADEAKLEKERAKAAKKREKDRAKQAKDAERYRKAADEARKKAADERARQEAQKTDPKYLEKQRKEAEKLKERGRKEMEKQRKRSEKLAKKAAKSKAKVEKKEEEEGGLAAVDRGAGRRGEHRGNRKPTNDHRAPNAERGSEGGPSRKKNSVIALVVVLAMLIGAVFLVWPPQQKITMGLDIQGGISVNLSAKTADGGDPSSDQMEQARQVIVNRVNSSGASNATVQQQGNNSFLVQVPGAADNSQKILDTLSSQGVLEFVDVENGIKSDKVKQYIQQGLTGMNLKDAKVKYTPFMTGDNVTQTTVGRPQGSADYAVNLQLDGTGTQEFATVSQKLVSTKGQIAILLDGKVMSAPAVQSAITNGQVQITGNFSADEANQLKTVIDSGSLPVSLSIESASTVGPTLGQNALFQGVLAAAIGLALVIVWMLVFYKGLGLLPTVSITIMTVVYMGILAGLSQLGWFSLTLPGIAGIIVNIGMSADSSILIMECFHEQIRQGKSLKTASRAGVHEGIFTSLDADFVTLVSALILYFVAVGDVRGFGLTLALGIACDLLIMALFSGPIMRLLGPNVIRKHPGFWGTVDDVNEGEFHAKEVK